MYIGHGSLRVCVPVGVWVCLCIYLSVLAAFPHYCTDPDLTSGNCRGALYLCMHYWVDLQSLP